MSWMRVSLVLGAVLLAIGFALGTESTSVSYRGTSWTRLVLTWGSMGLGTMVILVGWTALREREDTEGSPSRREPVSLT
jgi:hypothetical protein